MSQTSIVGKHRTKISRHGENTYITYWSTDVVAFDNDWILLKTDGYFTNTTKLRMNQASTQFSLGYTVYQKQFEWYVTYQGETYKFCGNSMSRPRKTHSPYPKAEGINA